MSYEKDDEGIFDNELHKKHKSINPEKTIG